MLHIFFFFQAEDGIRDIGVTGVQTCALPICKVQFIRLAILFVVLTTCTTAFADVKIKTRQTREGAGGGTENTTYIKGKRQRTESGGGEAVSIMQCDLRRSVQLAPAAKTYTVTPFGGSSGSETTAPTGANGRTETKAVRGGTVTSTLTIKDTGERRQMFGYTARHLLTTIETKSSDRKSTRLNSSHANISYAVFC